MRILLLGANGFIGRHIFADLLAAGHDVIGVARSTRALAAAFPEAEFVELDLALSLHAAEWAAHVSEVDVIVNAAGLLRGPWVNVKEPVTLDEASLSRIAALKATGIGFFMESDVRNGGVGGTLHGDRLQH